MDDGNPLNDRAAWRAYWEACEALLLHKQVRSAVTKLVEEGKVIAVNGFDGETRYLHTRRQCDNTLPLD